MKIDWFSWIGGLLFGAVIMLLFCAWRIGNIPAVVAQKEYRKIISACEQDLPRNKNCVLIAVQKEN